MNTNNNSGKYYYKNMMKVWILEYSLKAYHLECDILMSNIGVYSNRWHTHYYLSSFKRDELNGESEILILL